jgi:hypothetical protein
MLPILFRGHDEPGFFAHAVGMRPGENPLRPLPGNRRTDGARYACLIVVKDYFRMRASSGDAGGWHYRNIEPEILADVRAGRAVLVFDLSNEGPAYDAALFDELYAWIEANHLPAGRCIWLAQNRLMATAAAAHSGSRSSLVDFEHYDYFVKLMAWMFAQANTGETAGFQLAGYLEGLLDTAHKDKLLLCLNATPRLGRVLTIAALLHQQLLGQCIVSFPGMRYVKSGASLADVFAYLERNPGLEHLRPWVHVVGRMTPLRVDSFQEQGNALVEKIDPGAYRRTYFSLVTESDFAEPSIERVTEKTVKSFCMGHPTLIVGNARSAELMRGYGFQDWTTVLDRTADSTADPAARFSAVMAEVARQRDRIRSDPAAWLGATREVSAHNHRHAVSGDFLRRYIDAFDRRLIDKLTTLVSS